MYIGIDVGGTKIRAALLSPRFIVKDVVEIPTNVRKGRKVVIENIVDAAQELHTKHVRGIGVAIRGLVDFKEGVVLDSTMMPGNFRNVKLADRLRKQFKRPVKIENDVNCFALAEARLGAGVRKKHVIGITLGTGIGSGIVINGSIYRGAHGGASEIGHMVIDPCAHRWNTGQRGSFESLCSGTAAVKIYQLKTGKKRSTYDIEERFKKGERAAKETFKEMSEYLSIGLANVVHVFNPDVIVIGGGFGKLKFYVDPAIKQVSRRLVYSAHHKTKIKHAKLGQHAGLIGAAMLVKK